MNACKTILLVDDEPGYLQMLDFELSADGYKIITAPGGREAVELVRQEAPDLVITDMRMRPMDGLDTVRAIKTLIPKIPVYVMTGYATEDRLGEAVAIAGTKCLRKPFSLDDVRREISIALA